jgi:hypothetical protein
MKEYPKIPVRFLGTTPGGDVAVCGDAGRLRLPSGPVEREGDVALRYAPYLETVRGLIFRDSCREICTALSRRVHRDVNLSDIDGVDIRTEKHGHSYHVARVDLKLCDEVVSFAVNVAVTEEAKSSLKKEFHLLEDLGKRFGLPYLPRVFYLGSEPYRESGHAPRSLAMFVGEWFDGFHEFHLHRDEGDTAPRILLWDTDRGYRLLSDDQCLVVYRQAACVLTHYYDWHRHRQIHPWHHAAGDFVLRQEGSRVDLRLITVRDYTRVGAFETDTVAAQRAALLMFFLHLTLQMRLDRLDGVGEVAWAPEQCLHGVVAGFFRGLSGDERGRNQAAPSAALVLDLLTGFTVADWVNVLGAYLEAYPHSRDELRLIGEHADAHLREMTRVLAEYRLTE